MNRTMAAVVALMMVAGVAATALGAPDPVSAVADTAAANAKALTIGQGLAIFGASVGSGLAVLGGALGIGRIGGTCLESIARQPEAAGQLFAPMIITAAMIEGGMLFAVVVGLLGALFI